MKSGSCIYERVYEKDLPVTQYIINRGYGQWFIKPLIIFAANESNSEYEWIDMSIRTQCI